MKMFLLCLVMSLPIAHVLSAELLFRVDFDGSAVASVSKGRAEPLRAQNLVYVAGKRGQAVRMVGELGQFLEYSCKGNLLQERGTVAMWVKREWSDSGFSLDGQEIRRMLFSQHKPKKRRGSGMLSFSYWGPQLRADVSDFADCYTCKQHPIDEKWAHLIFTWDGAEKRIYLNGGVGMRVTGNGSPLVNAKNIMRKSDFFQREVFDSFYVGNCGGEKSADALIDDLRIYSAPLTVAEMKALYEEMATDEDRSVVLKPDYKKLFGNRLNPYEGGEKLELEPVETIDFSEANVRSLIEKNRFKSYRPTSFGELEGRRYLSADPRESSRFAVRFRLDSSVSLYCFDIVYPDDRERTMDIVIQKCDQTAWDGDVGADYTMQVGVMTGGLYANTGRMLVHRCLYWTRGSDVALLAMTARENGPAAISSVCISKVKGGKLPPLAVREPKPNCDGWCRQLSLFFEDPAIGYDFSVAHDGYTPEGLSELIDRTAATMKYTGETLFAYPGAWYDGLIGEDYNPRWHAPDFLSAWYEKFDHEGLSIMPTLNIHNLAVDPTLVTGVSAEDGSLHSSEIAILNTGRPNPGAWHGTPVNFNIAHTNVQRQLEATVDMLVTQGLHHPSFKGICLHLSRHVLLSFGGIEAGYNDYCIDGLVKSLGGESNVNGLAELMRVNRDDPLRGKEYARIISEDSVLREKWIDWRCKLFASFWGRIAKKMRERRSDLKLWINVFSTSYVRDTRFLRSDYVACQNREYGLDTSMLEGEADNLIICQSVIPADGRWRNPEVFPADVRDESVQKLTDYWAKQETWTLLDGARFPWAGQHDRYWECNVGANGDRGGWDWRAAKGANESNSLNCSWLKECKWRVTTINPSGRHALAPFVVPLRYHDLLGMSKGGFLIGTYGMEEPLREFAAAYRALPAVAMADTGEGDDVLKVRSCEFDGKKYVYVVNTSSEDRSIRLCLPEGSIDLVSGIKVFGLKEGAVMLKLRPYELKSFVAAGRTQEAE